MENHEKKTLISSDLANPLPIRKTQRTTSNAQEAIRKKQRATSNSQREKRNKQHTTSNPQLLILPIRCGVSSANPLAIRRQSASGVYPEWTGVASRIISVSANTQSRHSQVRFRLGPIRSGVAEWTCNSANPSSSDFPLHPFSR